MPKLRKKSYLCSEMDKDTVIILSGGMDSVTLLYDQQARIALAVSFDYAETWSCYKGGEKHCGKCGTCVERREALEEAGIEDPTEYLSE